MDFIKDFILSEYITLKMKGNARYGVSVISIEQLQEAIQFSKDKKIRIAILGGGSNITIPEYLDALVIKIDMKGVSFNGNVVTAWSGENWDELVKKTIENRLYGLENLSGIPGTVGASVVQNIGAYGVEVKKFIKSVTILNPKTQEIEMLNKDNCNFSYRDSIFKHDKLKIILNITLNLSSNLIIDKRYKNLSHLSDDITAEDFRKEIISIRGKKFMKCNSAGSFFKNILVNEKKKNKLLEQSKDLSVFKEIGGYKISTASILDKICNLKGYTVGNIMLSKHNPSVLLTNDYVTEKELEKFILDINKKVKDKININLDMEVLPIKSFYIR